MKTRHKNPMSYKVILDRKIHRKWPAPEQKEWWYAKYGAVRRKKLHRIHAEQNGQCFYCSVETWLSLPLGAKIPNAKKQFMATLDHIIPQSVGGRDHFSNLVMACNGCNSARSSMCHIEFKNLRSDVNAWQNYVRDMRKIQINRKKDKEEDPIKVMKRNALVFNIAILMQIDEKWIETVKQIRLDYEKMVGDRISKIVDNSLYSLEELGLVVKNYKFVTVEEHDQIG